jgi:hypothetical protein
MDLDKIEREVGRHVSDVSELIALIRKQEAALKAADGWKIYDPQNRVESLRKAAEALMTAAGQYPEDETISKAADNVDEALKNCVGDVVIPKIGDDFAGGIYAGIARGQNGQPDYHLVLMPGDIRADFNEAKEFAEAAGSDLPTRHEQSLLFANLKDKFKAAWYWSGEQHEALAGCAWTQYFGDGLQTFITKSYAGRARAVRRLVI